MVNVKNTILNYLWNIYPDLVLDRFGLKNNTIRQDTRFFNLFLEILHQKIALITFREMYNIYSLVNKVSEIEGDIAEVGVYKGGSAKIICEMKGDKHLHLFDTFEGMPQTDDLFDLHKKGDFQDISIDQVRNLLEKYNNVHFHKGYFPESATTSDNISSVFSFVHLDADLYESTLNGLKYFYGRINKGGILVSHDYRSISCPGVKKAFDEFMSDKTEPIVELWDSQCMFIKH